MGKKYMIVLRADSSLRITKEGGTASIDVKTADTQAKVYFSDILEEHHGIKTHKHTQIEVELYEDTIDIATQKATNIANFFLGLASFSSGAAISTPKIHIAYETTPNVEDREFIQFFYNFGIPNTAKRDLDFDKFNLLLKKDKSFAGNNRLMRAIRWYRTSLLEPDKLNRFSHIWVALESLNPLIKDKFDISSDIEECTNCGYKKSSHTAIGIKYLITNYLDNGESIYKEAVNTRNGVVHGYIQLDQLLTSAEKLIPEIEAALKKAILLLLDIPIEENESWFKKPLTNLPRLYVRAGCLIHQPNVHELGKEGQHPHFKDEYLVINSQQEPDGKTKFTFNMSLTPFFNGSYTPQFMDAYGPEEGVSIEISDHS